MPPHGESGRWECEGEGGEGKKLSAPTRTSGWSSWTGDGALYGLGTLSLHPTFQAKIVHMCRDRGPLCSAATMLNRRYGVRSNALYMGIRGSLDGENCSPSAPPHNNQKARVCFTGCGRPLASYPEVPSRGREYGCERISESECVLWFYGAECGIHRIVSRDRERANSCPRRRNKQHHWVLPCRHTVY